MEVFAAGAGLPKSQVKNASLSANIGVKLVTGPVREPEIVVF
jgi:hypothetical protein